jgi:hypothetical protein
MQPNVTALNRMIARQTLMDTFAASWTSFLAVLNAVVR